MGIFKLYGCESKEELYRKLKNKESDVESLQEFLEFAKGSIALKKGIGSPNEFAAYYASSEHAVSNPDEAMCLFINTQSIPVHHSIVNLDDKKDLQTKLKDGLSSGASSVFIVSHTDMSYAKSSKTERFFNSVGLEVMDKFVITPGENQLYSSEASSYIPIRISPDYSLKEEKDTLNLNTYEGYKEFVKHYTQKETVGLNLLADNATVLENLKVGYQHELNEYLGIITYKDDYTIDSVQEVAIGGVNSAVVDPRVVLEKVLANDDVRGFALFHNHPGGGANPSAADESITMRIEEVCSHLDVEFLDHYIVGKKDTYSFDKQSSKFDSPNREYRNNIRGINYQNAFNLEI